MFAFESILWIGLPLASLPVLIHLINLVRHRRVKWAAMDFLLAAQKRHKNWIILKQLLLLLMRMAAIALVALMLAQPILRNQWGELFGGAKTHHIVLLDDSYSMSDRRADGPVFDAAKRMVARLGGQAAAESSEHTVSLVRFSSAADLALGAQPDMIQEIVDATFAARLEQVLAEMQPSQTAAGVLDALESVERLPATSKDENRILYIVSDFRAAEWNEPDPVRQALDELSRKKVKIHLVHCVDAARPNLAITELKPHVGTRAAGVELMMDVAVTNYGDQAVKEVPVSLEEDGNARPGFVIREIGPGQTVTRQFRVFYPHAGQHTLTASLPADPLLLDNRRFAVVDVPESVPVLLIDGEPQARDAYFLSMCLAPGGSVETGLAPQIEPPLFLRKHEELAKFQSIYLLNVPRIDAPEIEALEAYVQNGGGAAFFVGELTQNDFYNSQLYRAGAGLFPLPLGRSTNLLVDRLEKSPDLDPADHPVFRPFLLMRNNPLDEVLVERYFTVPDDWRPDPQSTVEVIARLRNGAPLMVERRFGDGRAVAVLTKASPEKTSLGRWNNWARTHSFLPAVLSLQGFLATGRRQFDEHTVGQVLAVQINGIEYQPQIRFTTPADGSAGTLLVEASGKGETLGAELRDTSHSGFYEARVNTKDGREEDRRFAYNVAKGEGDLHMLTGQQLASRLEGLNYRFHRAQDLNYDPQDVAGFNLSDSLLYLLVGLLFCEQMLAYSATYHPRKEAARR